MWRRTNEVYVGVCSVYWRRGKEGGGGVCRSRAVGEFQSRRPEDRLVGRDCESIDDGMD